MSKTIITSATVRVMQSHNYSNFEVIKTLENPEGITSEEISSAIQDCHLITNETVKEYKENRHIENKASETTERGRLVEEAKNLSNKKITEAPPEEIAVVESYPTYEETKAAKKGTKASK